MFVDNLKIGKSFHLSSEMKWKKFIKESDYEMFVPYEKSIFYCRSYVCRKKATGVRRSEGKQKSCMVFQIDLTLIFQFQFAELSLSHFLTFYWHYIWVWRYWTFFYILLKKIRIIKSALFTAQWKKFLCFHGIAKTSGLNQIKSNQRREKYLRNI